MFQKFKKVLIYTFLIIIGLLIFTFLLLQSSLVQTYITKNASKYLSENFDVNTSIEKVNIAFPNLVKLENLVVLDHKSDTLAIIGSIKVDLNKPLEIAQKVDIKNAYISQAKFKIITYPGDSINSFTTFINNFSSEDTTSSSGSANIHLNHLSLESSELHLLDSSTNMVFKTEDLLVTDFILNDSLLSVDLSNSDIEIVDMVKSTNINGNYQIINNKIMALNDFSVTAGSSYLKTSARIQFKNTDMDWVDYKTKYNLDVDSLIYFKEDVNYALINDYIPSKVNIKGTLSGTAKTIKLDQLIVKTNQSIADLSGRIKYPFIPRKTNLKFNFNTLNIDQYVANFYLKETGVSDNLMPLFPLQYKGLYKGNFIYNESNGQFKTAIGNIYTDIQILLEDNAKNAIYFANLTLDNFRLNTLLDESDFGSSTMKINIDGEGFDWDNLNVKLDANINEFVYKNYVYTDVISNGSIQKDRYAGHLTVEDSNLSLNFNGLVDLRQGHQNLDFKAQIENIDLYALNLTDSLMTISTDIDVVLDNINIDKADGTCVISEFNLSNQNGDLHMDTLILNTKQQDETERTLEINSDFIDVLAHGDFKLVTLPKLIESELLPYLNYKQEKHEGTDQTLDLQANIKNSTPITNVFIPDLKIAPNANISINKAYKKLPEIHFTAPYVVYNNKGFINIAFHTIEENNSLFGNLTLEDINLRMDGLQIKNISIKNDLIANTMLSEIKWDAAFDSTNYSGHLFVDTDIDTNFSVKSVLLDQSSLFMADSLWDISPNNLLTLDNGQFSIHNLNLSANQQALVINSLFGADSNSFTKVDFSEFNMANLNPYLIKSNTEIGGLINGSVHAMDITGNIEIESLLTLDSTYVNKIYFGNILAYSYHDYDLNKAGFEFDVLKMNDTIIAASLEYDIDKGFSSYQIDADVNKLRVDFADPYINEWVEDLKGRISGHIRLKEGKVYSQFNLEKINFKIPAIGTRYNIEGKPQFLVDSDKFHIPEFKLNVLKKSLKSKKFGQAILTGNIYHKDFLDYKYDLGIEFNDFLCLSTTFDDETIFYGDALASGHLTMTGENASPIIKIDASTDKGTELTLAYSDQSEIAEETFIRFKVPKKDTVIVENIFDDEPVETNDLEIDLNLKVNPSSLVTFNVDESVLTGRGSGDLNFKFNSNLDFDLYGNYVVEKADYMFAFTTGLVEAKKFDIEKGGKVNWSGDPMRGIMDIKAQYNSNLPSLDPNETQNKDVYSVINLKGQLLQPEVNFDIEIPNATDEEQVVLSELTNSEEKLAKQFLSILIMNSFYVENQGVTENLNNQLVNSTAGLLTSQLNKWLNETQDEFDMGIRINPGTGGELNSQEVEFFLSKNLLDDRLRLNGNVGTPIGFNTSRVKGNFELEYDIKKDGKLKLTVFSRSGETTTDQDVVQNTQGIGLFYRLEYNSIFNFLKKKRRPQN